MEIDYLIELQAIPKDLLAVQNQPENALYEVLTIYRKVLESKLLWKVWQIDNEGAHWLEVNLINELGEAEFHTLKLDEGTYCKHEFEPYTVLREEDNT